MLNDNNGALEDYNIAIELNPKDAEAFNNRGVVKKRLDFNVGALSDYSQAIALNPNDSIAYANRGRLKKLYFDNEGAAIDLDQAIALAEKQTFIKNVKPLLSNESYIAAIPSSFIKNDNIYNKAETRIASNSSYKPSQTVNRQEQNIKPVNQIAQASQNIQTTKRIVTSTPKQTTIQIQQKTQIAKTPVSMPAAVEEKIASSTISAGVATVQAAADPIITTTAIKKNPTTNIKLAESYYIRGLQKCVLRDLQGAIADLNKAIENNNNYADAYYYRAAIRKELGDNEGFRSDYSKAIQINPSLQAFNDANCLSLIRG